MSITVGSFNVQWGRRSASESSEPFDVVDACGQIDVDVLALQEVWRRDGEPSLAEQIADALGYECHQVWTARTVVKPRPHLVGRTGEAVGDGDWGQALLTRVTRGPVTEHRLDGFVFDATDRLVMTTEVTVDGEPLVVCASHFPHLEHLSPLLRWRLRGVLPPRERAAILMGDLNMWRWTARLVVPGWRDTVRGATWPSTQPIFQIDHILATPSVDAADAEVVRAGASDHLPVRARVSVRS